MILVYLIFIKLLAYKFYHYGYFGSFFVRIMNLLEEFQIVLKKIYH